MGDNQFWTHTGLAKFSNISDGDYYITVNAINKAGYGGSMVTTVHHSTPYLVDTQPPTVTEWRTISYNKTTNELIVHYNVRYVLGRCVSGSLHANYNFLLHCLFLLSSDSGSGVSDVSLALGLTRHDIGLLDWVTLATSGGSGVLVTSVYVPDGVSAWVKLRVTDKGRRSGHFF